MFTARVHDLCLKESLSATSSSAVDFLTNNDTLQSKIGLDIDSGHDEENRQSHTANAAVKLSPVEMIQSINPDKCVFECNAVFRGVVHFDCAPSASPNWRSQMKSLGAESIRSCMEQSLKTRCAVAPLPVVIQGSVVGLRLLDPTTKEMLSCHGMRRIVSMSSGDAGSEYAHCLSYQVKLNMATNQVSSLVFEFPSEKLTERVKAYMFTLFQLSYQRTVSQRAKAAAADHEPSELQETSL